jgi:hypothetical protein
MAEDGKTLLGVLAVDMSLARLTELIRSTRISENAVTYLVDSRGLLVASSVDEDLSRKVDNATSALAPAKPGCAGPRVVHPAEAQHGKTPCDTGSGLAGHAGPWLETAARACAPAA